MRNLLGLNEDFTVADTTFSILPAFKLSDSLRVSQNANLQLALKDVDIAKANVKVERSVLLPDFTLGYFIQSMRGNQDVNGSTVNYNGALQFNGVSAGISIPIFAGSSLSRIKAAKTGVEARQLNAEYIKKQLQSQYVQEIEQLQTFESMINYYTQTALPNAKVISDNSTKAYMNGDIAYVEYIQGLETALAIRTNYINAINNYNQAVINLQYLLNQ